MYIKQSLCRQKNITKKENLSFLNSNLLYSSAVQATDWRRRISKNIMWYTRTNTIAEIRNVWETGTGTGRKEKVTGSRHGEGVKSGNRFYSVYTPNRRGDASKYFADILGYIDLNIYEDPLALCCLSWTIWTHMFILQYIVIAGILCVVIVFGDFHT
jgi:hypothetical protein